MSSKTPAAYIEARRLYAAGEKRSAILRRLGIPMGSWQAVFGVTDPYRKSETDEQRVWRRFPITAHKPGYER